jgi:hypothetical protein
MLEGRRMRERRLMGDSWNLERKEGFNARPGPDRVWIFDRGKRRAWRTQKAQSGGVDTRNRLNL